MCKIHVSRLDENEWMITTSIELSFTENYEINHVIIVLERISGTLIKELLLSRPNM